MHRREFLTLGIAAGLGMRIETPGFDPDEGPLWAACRQGARERGVVWTPRIEARLEEEISDLRNVGCERELARLGAAVSSLKREGALFAPGIGSLVSSMTAYLLHLTEINPLAAGLPFSVLHHGLESSAVDAVLAIERRAVRPLMERSGASPWLRLHGPTDVEACELGNVFLFLEVMDAEGPRSARRDEDSCRPLALLEPFSRYLAGCSPSTVPELVLAVALFRRGAVEEGRLETILKARNGGPTGGLGPQETGGLIIFEEDELSLVARTLRISLRQASRLSPALRGGASEGPGWSVVDRLLSGRPGGTELRSRLRGHFCSWAPCGLLKKTTPLGLAMLLGHVNDVLRLYAWGQVTAGCRRDHEWAWDAAYLTERLGRRSSEPLPLRCEA
jgi:hypothetical protein